MGRRKASTPAAHDASEGRRFGHSGKQTDPESTSQLPATQLDNPILIEHADAIRQLGKRVVSDVVEIGRRLTEAKEIAGHGNWLSWLEREFGWSPSTAE